MNEQKYTAILNELLTGPNGHSYWARKSRLLALEGELSPLEFKLLEFDVSFRSSHAMDLARSAEKIFKADKSSERVRQCIGQLFALLLDTQDRQFSTEVVRELSMEMLQEMFFFAFPEQRNSPKGSLQVYLTLASNQPQSLGTIATKLFAYYLGASAEFQRGSGLSTNKEEEITPMDAVLFYLFDSLVKARFGDLSIHNTMQIFHIVLRNCFADTMGRVPEDFYSQSGIPCLGAIARPSACWHICFHILAQLLQQRGQHALCKALEPLPTNNAEMAQALKRTIGHSTAGTETELMRCSEFVQLALCWTMSTTGIRNVQSDPCRMFVHVPANIFWIEPSALERYWNYNLDVEDEESPAEPGEPQPLGEEGVERALQIDEPSLIEPISMLNSLFADAGGGGPSVAEKELPKLGMPNALSIAVLALMASENWKQALELLQRSPTAPIGTPEHTILCVEQLETLIALRKLDQAFPLAMDLLSELAAATSAPQQQEQQADGMEVDNDGIDTNTHDTAVGASFPALVVSHQSCWVKLTHHTHLLLYTQLLLFHVCWLAFAKCQQNARMAQSGGQLMFLVLILLIQACWPDFGFGLFEQLVEHVAQKTQFRCPNLLAHITNCRLLGELLGLEHCQMDLCTSADSEQQPANYMKPSDIFCAILDGKMQLAPEQQSAFAIMMKCIVDNRQRLAEVFTQLH